MEHGAVGEVLRWNVSPGISVARFSAKPTNKAILRASSARNSDASWRFMIHDNRERYPQIKDAREIGKK